MITKLTHKQEAAIPEYVDKWTKIGLSTDPIDEQAASEAVDLLYVCGGLKPPHKVFVASPMAALKYMKDNHGKNEKEEYNNFIYGSYDVDFLSFYDFFSEEFNLKEETKSLIGLNAVAKTCGWLLPYDKLCVITERPMLILRDEQGRLHSTTGKALEYNDGWGIYAHHGVRVPAEVIETDYENCPLETIKALIMDNDNTEVRAVVMTMAQDRLGQLLNNIADLECDDKYGKLYRLKDENFAIKILLVVNSTPEPDGTFKNYILFVPREMKDAKEAVAWTFNMKKEDYNPIIET